MATQVCAFRFKSSRTYQGKPRKIFKLFVWKTLLDADLIKNGKIHTNGRGSDDNQMREVPYGFRKMWKKIADRGGSLSAD